MNHSKLRDLAMASITEEGDEYACDNTLKRFQVNCEPSDYIRMLDEIDRLRTGADGLIEALEHFQSAHYDNKGHSCTRESQIVTDALTAYRAQIESKE